MTNPRNAGQPEPDLEAAAGAVEQSGGAQEKPASIGIRRTGTTFGIHKKDTRKTGGDPTDYTKRYGKDVVGQEMSSRGRFWLTYLDEALVFDEEMVEMHKDNIDVLLVFAGLFSAILSTFVIQTAQNLQPDYTAVSASLLIELVGYQRAASDSSSIPLSPFYPAISFSPSLADVWVNSLWFFSLALSLTTALVAVLTKQWLHQYISVVSDISPLGRGRIRQYRYMGLEKWQVPMIIGLLPILLHVSLGLFFTGLCIYLFALHAVIAYTVASLSGIVYAAYLIFLFLPLFHYNCPYKTPLTDYLFGIYRTIYNISRFICCRGPLNHNAIPRTTRDAERRGVHLAEVRDAIDAEAISWLHSTSSNTSVQRIALEAALGIHLDSRRGNANNIIDEIFERHSGLELETHRSPASSKRPDQIPETISKDTTSSLLAILHSQGDNIVLPEGIWTCLLNYEEWKVPLHASESASLVIQLAAKLIEAWRKGLTPDPSQRPPIPSSKRRPLRDYLSSKDSEATLALVNGLSIMTRTFFKSSAAGDLVDVMRMFGYKLRDEKSPQNVKLLVHGISDTIRVIQRLPAQYLDQKSRAQNAFLISSSCIFPKLEEPESKTHLALLEILCCSDRYAFTLTDVHSQPETFFTNAVRCFLSSCSYRTRPNHLELKVIERIVGPFFNQGYITDRGHTQVKFLRFFGPYFELKDCGILLKIFEEEGGLQALGGKFIDMLEQSATPKELAPTTGFAHLVANQMIETNTFDPLHLPDSTQKSPFTDSLSMLIHLLLYNSSGLLTIGRLLKTLHQRNMAQSTWKEFVEQLRQWMADKREELGHLYNIEDIHRVPDVLLEKADVPLELLADPRSIA